MIDLDAYFARIGYTGLHTASLTTLRAIHALHPATIPFENLDPLLGRPVPLGLADLQQKMVEGRRGGYCFEQNTLFQGVLQALGFPVTAFAARVLWMMPAGSPPSPRTHMVLQVALEDGPYLADVGFGGYLLAAPLRLVADLEQTTPAGLLRLRQADGSHVLQARLEVEWHDVYRFTLEPQAPIDREVGNWFTSTHPKSRFRNNLLMERLTPELRLSLANKRLTRRYPDGRAETSELTSPAELGEILAEFGVEPPADAASVFARLPA
jgi:N-hydroxyarylamine O-acetyltransferase